MVIVCGGPKGTGMQEVAQITIALKYLSYGKEVALTPTVDFLVFQLVFRHWYWPRSIRWWANRKT